MADADLGGDLLALFELTGRQARANAGDGHGPLAQGHLGGLGQHGAVEPSGKRHGATTETLEQLDQLVSFSTQPWS